MLTSEAINLLGRREYTRLYRAGWRHSERAKDPSIDNNPHGGAAYWAWEDGYMDYAGDRKKYHRRDCPLDDHNECERQ